MGRAACGEKSGLKKGLWTPEEDEKLVNHIVKHGHGNWSTVPKLAGLARSGKSCRLRWTNYLRPDIKRGHFSFEEEETIVQLHRVLGTRWSTIAMHLPGRTDNEIKNYWNTHICKRLLRTDIHRSFTSYLEVEETGSIASSSSGTIVSIAYTSSVSCPSTTISMEEAMHFASLEIDEDVNGNNVQLCEEAEDEKVEDEETEERMKKRRMKKRRTKKLRMKKQRMKKHIISLVQEFFSAPSANCSIKVGDISVVERWLKVLSVGWVLRLHDDGASAAAGEEKFDRDARTWIRALGRIAQTFCSMRPLFPDPDSVGLHSLCQREEHVGERSVPDRYHLALFVLETMSKILNFVDVIAAWDPDMTQEFLSMDQVMPPPYNRLITQLVVHDALSKVSYKILTQINRSTSVEGRRIESKMASLLSECKGKLGEVISSTIEKIRTMLMEDGDDSSSPRNPQGSSDIHKVTRSVMTYIRLLRANYSSVDAAMPSTFACHTENERPFYSMITQMVRCLQEKLANISESFSDQGLRFLFLLNNSYFIQELLSFYSLQRHLLDFDLNDKMEDHMERYLQVSWALLSSCLINPTPLCLGKNYSPLSKFESEFQKIYTTQKEWKVPDPGLRTKLRKVIIDKIIPGYTDYIEDNKVTNPKFSPQELKEMLQELFEG